MTVLRRQLVMFCVGMGAMAGVSAGQDTRLVAEPVIPPNCVQLAAKLQSVGGKLDEGDEQKLDTARIQAALDGCKAGQAVELRAMGEDTAFLTGPLELRSGVTLLIDEGVTLFGSRDPKVYEIAGADGTAGEAARCGTAMARPVPFGKDAPAPPRPKGGCRALISATNVTNAAVMGDGVIDGRGYAKLLGRDFSWWEMARRAEPKDDLYFSSKLIVANHADGLVLYRITLHNSPNYHVTVSNTNGFTAWGVHLLTPVDKSLDARNTDGIDPGNSTNITIAHSWIDNGDDNVAIKANVQHMSVLDNHFYSGHGMSIGSEATGDAYLLVDGLVEDHTTSGIRIKSNVTRGGYDHDLTYRNICMRNVANPIAISPYYTNQTVEGFVDPKYTGTKIPEYKKIKLENVFSETPGNVLIAGIDDAHRTEITLDRVRVAGIKPDQVHLAYVDITLIAHGDNGGAAATNFDVSHGESVKVIRGGYLPAAGKSLIVDYASPCAGRFVPMQ